MLLFNNLFEEMGSKHKVLLKYIEGQWLSGSKTVVQIELAMSFIKQHVYLKEQLAAKLWLFRHDIWE